MKPDLSGLVDVGRRLQDITAGCREDMHEPDEQGLQARVVGFKLDNAMGEQVTEHGLDLGYQELVVVLDRLWPDGQRVERFNLADLVALARMGAAFLDFTGDRRG